MRSRLADAGPSLGVCAVSAGLIAHACNAEPEKPKGGKAERSWVHALLGPDAVATSEQPTPAKKLKLRRGMRLPSDTRDALILVVRSAPPAPEPELVPPPPPAPRPEPPKPLVVARK
ncbi:MAG: hypothetical protein DYH12_36420, partial [Sorangiineae bacterium PRO1]|nr:hypothetical protein [Sorangiineae bacterium PRO1]